tara:strand:+ start:1699 stop:2721 length:1023 start_codon:yes stop_codon:yes gene_type:complete
MKILITGGCGFVGANLCINLSKEKHQVFSLDNLSRKGSYFNFNILRKLNIRNFKFDISDYKKILRLPKFDLIIDCCAEASVEVSRNDMDRVINTNLIGTFNILKKANKEKSKIIFMSSSRVNSIDSINKIFGKKKLDKPIKIDKKINENFDTLKPKSIYGLTKLTSEMLIQEFSYAFDLKYIINRCGVISGPLQFGKQDQGFVSLWIWSHIIRKNLKYIGFGGKGHQVRDVLHIDDLTDLIKLQIKKFNIINNELFSVGGSNFSHTSLKELTNMCEKVTGNKIKFKKDAKSSIYDIPYFITDNSKVTKAYGWKPKRKMLNVVSDTYKWLFINKKEINKYL